ncbi:MAG: orotidine-5'-phosphate decarboxylase [Candidatus Gastranaerophilales bacterium]|nr:orotidine-5'-phosphate decarboxylase [Candidatus Gastranaerophilales bacterium]
MDREKLPKDYLVLALDVDTIEEAAELVRELKDYVGMFKVGLQLYTSEGSDVIKMIQDEGAKVFFDGKFHDIPNTVAKASSTLVKKGVNTLTVHIKGGSKMLATTVKMVKETAKKYHFERPKILGVSILTSFGQRTLTEEIKVSLNIDEYALALSKMAKDAGLDGVLSASVDVASIKKTCGEDFIVMCPAVRPTWSVVNDQVRVITPADAIKAGFDYMIIGRPITSAPDRISAVNLILDEIEATLLKQDDERFI